VVRESQKRDGESYCVCLLPSNPEDLEVSAGISVPYD
jgi:hypothetical protein